jgi:hypothetical protein
MLFTVYHKKKDGSPIGSLGYTISCAEQVKPRSSCSGAIKGLADGLKVVSNIISVLNEVEENPEAKIVGGASANLLGGLITFGCDTFGG